MYGFVVTTAGEGLLARAAAGDTLTITAVRVGSGAVGSASAAKALTALIQDRAAGTYSTPQVSGGQLSLVAEYRNNLNGGLQTGFTLREFGVFARAGDDAPTLMYYAALGDRAPQVPPITEGLDVHRYPVAVAVSGELSVTVEDPAGAFVTDAELADYVPLSQKGQAGGVASLGSDGKVPEAQLPEMDYLPLSGGTMLGNLNMGAHRLTGLPAPQADSDAARKSDVEASTKISEETVAQILDSPTPGKQYTLDEMVQILGYKPSSKGLVVLQIKTADGTAVEGLAVTTESYPAGGEVLAYSDGAGNAVFEVEPDTPVQVWLNCNLGLTGQSIHQTVTCGGSRVAAYAVTVAPATGTTLSVQQSALLAFPSYVASADLFAVGGGGSGAACADRNMTGDSYVQMAASGGAGGYTQTLLSHTPKRRRALRLSIGAGGPSCQLESGDGNQIRVDGQDGGATSAAYDGDAEPLLTAAGGKGGEANVSASAAHVTGAPGGTGSGGVYAARYPEPVSIGVSETNGWDGEDAAGSELSTGGQGQGTTTCAFGESSGTAYSPAGGGAGLTYRHSNNAYNSKAVTGGGGGGGDGAQAVKPGTGSGNAHATADDGAAPGAGGGGAVAYSPSNDADVVATSGAGAGGLILIRWEAA